MVEFPKFTKADDKPAPRWFHIAVAVAMLLGAAASLIGTIRTSSAMRDMVKQNAQMVEQNARLVRANSTPLLMFGHGNISDDGKPRLTFDVTNVGTGPARIVWFELRVNGKPAKEMGAAIDAVAERVDGERRFNSSPVAPRILSPRDKSVIFAWDKPSDTNPQLAAWQTLDRARFSKLSVEACYCSVFEQCWTSTLSADVPKPVEACDPTGRVSLKG
jgi:hypothetical protein